MRKKTDSYLGFARRAGRLVTGAGTCETLAPKGKLKLMIIAEDISEDTRRKMENLALKNGISCRIYGNADHLSHITGTSGRSVFGITDKGFAEAIETEIDLEKSEEREVF